MAKNNSKTVYVCSNCGAESPKWQGRCFNCGGYNTFQSITVSTGNKNQSTGSVVSAVSPTKLKDVNQKSIDRIKSGIEEVDQTLGGGFVKGQVVLLGGEPGIGKSTLTLQIASNFESIYVCGEESETQIKMRADRMGIVDTPITLLREQVLENLIDTLENLLKDRKSEDPLLLIVDSIQSIYSTSSNSIAGSISQVQLCTNRLVEIAKNHALILVLIGQITKSGMFAGPKLLEHIVDTVLYFEGERREELRLIRVIKNRFGPTDQVGIFKMEEMGFKPVGGVISELIKDRPEGVPGSVLSVVLEGQRPMFLEVQALNARSSFGNARRVVNGISLNRLHMLLAVLERRARIRTNDYDFYLNITGGFKISDPGIDLPVLLAIASVVKNKPLPADLVAFGEVGLLGEIKPASFENRRRQEAERIGYKNIIDSKSSKNLSQVIRQVFGS